jgi:hypothetical protein
MGDHKRVISADEVEAAASDAAEFEVPAGALVTPLARQRAAELGVALVTGTAAASASQPGSRVAMEAKARELAESAVAARGGGPSQVDELVAAVMRLLAEDCRCGEHR